MATDLAGATHIGLRRKENQDGFLTEVFQAASGPPITCIAVADGMGGHDEGRLASAEAIESVRAQMTALIGRDPAAEGPLTGWLREIELAAHGRVAAIAGANQTVGTTLTVALIRNRKCLIGHVGDSRAYRYHSGVLEQVTSDHTWEAYSKAKNMENPYGKALKQAVGVGAAIEPDAFELLLDDNDWLLVCSDGLYKMISDDEIGGVLSRARSAKSACDLLIQLALEAGGKDNVAVCIGRLKSPATVGGNQNRNTDIAIVVLSILAVALLVWVVVLSFAK